MYGARGLAIDAAGRYAGVLRSAILLYKRGRRDAGDALSALLADRVADSLPANCVLVPVPTTRQRRGERGFDQGVRLARGLGTRTGLPVLLALAQVAGDAQRGRSRNARLAARGRFTCVAPDLIGGASVVLVDDVMTTGATLMDCACALERSGGIVAGAVVLAYAQFSRELPRRASDVGLVGLNGSCPAGASGPDAALEVGRNGMAKALWNGKTLAESDNIEVVEGNLYFPADSIDCTLFKKSDTTSVCPWKGTASYYTLVVDGKENPDAAWYYPTPKDAAKQIKDRVAFWKGVEVVK